VCKAIFRFVGIVLSIDFFCIYPYNIINKAEKGFMMNSKYAFISYSHKDSDRVIPIINALEELKVALWYDNGIEVGTEWPEYIAERISDASVFIIFMSPSAAASVNCRNEINYALSLRKKMLTIYLEPTDMSAGMQLQLGSIQAIFYYRYESMDAFIDDLLHSMILQEVISAEDAVTSSAEDASLIADGQDNHESAAAPAPDKPTVEESDRDKRIRKTFNILIPSFTVIAVALGAVEMHFVTKYVDGGLLIFLLGVIAPLLVYIPWFKICLRKMKGYNGNLRSHISGNVILCLTFAFLAQVIIDVSFIHSTDNVFFKILISLGINLITYFIALLSTPSIKSKK